jgi:hypothetical protein
VWPRLKAKARTIGTPINPRRTRTGGRDMKKPKVDNLAALGAARLLVSVTSMLCDT